MSLLIKIRRGDGPVYRRIKSVAKSVLRFHLPVAGPSKPIFAALYYLHVFMREASGWMVRFFWYEPLFRSQCVSVGERFRMEQLPYVVGRGRIAVGSGVVLSGKPSIAFNNRAFDELPELRIGDNTFIGHGCAMNIGRRVSIGNHCLLAAYVQIADQDGHPLDAERRRLGEPTPAETIKPVTIGNDVWIGGGAMILKGVTIGDRAIIGARAVVTRDVPPDTVVVGNPARQVKRLVNETTEMHRERNEADCSVGANGSACEMKLRPFVSEILSPSIAEGRESET